MEPLKVLSTLIRDAYMGKLMSLGDMVWDSHTVVTMHTEIALSAYSCHKV